MTIPGFSSRFQLAPDSSKLFPVSVRNRYRDWSSPVDEATTFCKQSRLLGLFFLWKVMNQRVQMSFRVQFWRFQRVDVVLELGGISPCWQFTCQGFGRCSTYRPAKYVKASKFTKDQRRNCWQPLIFSEILHCDFLSFQPWCVFAGWRWLRRFFGSSCDLVKGHKSSQKTIGLLGNFSFFAFIDTFMTDLYSFLFFFSSFSVWPVLEWTSLLLYVSMISNM